MLQANTYWRYPYRPVLTNRQLVEFVVLDVEQVGPPTNSKFVLADVQVCFLSSQVRLLEWPQKVHSMAVPERTIHSLYSSFGLISWVLNCLILWLFYAIKLSVCHSMFIYVLWDLCRELVLGLRGWFREIQVAKASDFGRNDRTFFVRTHLGHLLHAGDSALGYDMSTANTVDADLEAAVAKGFTVPDIILVSLLFCPWLSVANTGS